MPTHGSILVLDLHVQPPPFAGPLWLPEEARIEVRRVLAGELPEEPRSWSHVVISGSSLSILEDPDFLPAVMAFLQEAVAAGTPVMGVCYGAQLIARALLGREHVRSAPGGVEVGWLPVEVMGDGGGWFNDLPRPFHTWHFHLDEVCNLPPPWRVLARSAGCEIQAFDHPELQILGVQFHPEMDLEHGNECFRLEADKVAMYGQDAERLIAEARDDGARILFRRFVERCAPLH